MLGVPYGRGLMPVVRRPDRYIGDQTPAECRSSRGTGVGRCDGNRARARRIGGALHTHTHTRGRDREKRRILAIPWRRTADGERRPSRPEYYYVRTPARDRIDPRYALARDRLTAADLLLSTSPSQSYEFFFFIIIISLPLPRYTRGPVRTRTRYLP